MDSSTITEPSSTTDPESTLHLSESETSTLVSDDAHIPSDLFHPLFSSPEGDIILSASGGNTLFRVHSFTLKTTSGWFRAMFSLPQKTSPTFADVIYLDEDAQTLDALLRMVCGQPVLRLETFDMVESILYAAEKYDMPGPVSIGHLIMTLPLTDQPLRLYAVACRYGWEEESRVASTETLKLNIHDPEHRPALQRLSTDALLDLFALHRERRELLRARLDVAPFIVGGTTLCGPCGWRLDYHTWRELKHRIIMEMDVRPLGDTILQMGLLEWEEALACWSAKCPNKDCKRVLYDKTSTIGTINSVIADLRSCI